MRFSLCRPKNFRRAEGLSVADFVYLTAMHELSVCRCVGLSVPRAIQFRHSHAKLTF